MTLLSIVQEATARIALTQPTAVAGSTISIAQQMRSLAQQEGEELSRRYNWRALQVDQTFISTATESQTNALPTDWGRFVDGSFWNRDRRRPVNGPMRSSDWAELRGRNILPPIVEVFRLYGARNILILPVPTAGQTYAYTYITNQFCETSAGAGLEAWASDTDVARIPERLFVLGITWRFLQARGFDATAERATYEAQVVQAMAHDQGGRVLDFSGQAHWGPRIPAIPEGSWSL
jgi:hypothetical protein